MGVQALAAGHLHIKQVKQLQKKHTSDGGADGHWHVFEIR